MEPLSLRRGRCKTCSSLVFCDINYVRDGKALLETVEAPMY